MVVQTATFLVADPAALQQALEAREDINPDEPGTWHWVRRRGDDNTVLALLERIGDQLLVELNSDERLAAIDTVFPCLRSNVQFAYPRAAGGVVQPTSDSPH